MNPQDVPIVMKTKHYYVWGAVEQEINKIPVKTKDNSSISQFKQGDHSLERLPGDSKFVRRFWLKPMAISLNKFNL